MNISKNLLVPFWRKMALTAMLSAVIAPAWTVSASEASDRLQQVLELLSTTHVSGVSEEALSDAAIQAMVEALNDPYTEYMSKQEWGQFVDSLSRNYVGIGVQIGQSAEGIYIEQVFPGTPAEEAGLLRNDVIVEVDSTPITDHTTEELVALIVGEADTPVTVTVRRGTEKLAKTMLRKAVSLPVVEGGYFDGVGYLKVHSFSEDADEQFAQKLEEMKASGDFRSLVVDLRNNPGGLLESAGYIASNFIKDSVLIHTKTRAGTDEPAKIVGGSTLDVPVYVLVNENSASASEVLAGALQDYGAAVIAGNQTYGKGSVQSVYSLKDGSMLKITVEEYFTPNGHPVNQVGITPDIQLDGSLNQLLTVLRLAGVQEFQLRKDRAVLTVNGMQVTDALPVIEQDGKLWIHSRVLAAIIGAEVEWLADVGGVRINREEAASGAVFTPQEGNALQVEDYLFLDAAAFAGVYPQVHVEGDAAQLVLQSGAGGE